MDLVLNEKTAARRELAKSYEKQRRDDLAVVCVMPEGQRFLADLLKNMGIGRQIDANEGDAAVRNFGIGLINRITVVDPKACMAILAQVFNLFGEAKL